MSAPFPSPTTKWHSTTYDSLSPTRPELSAKGKNVVVTGGGTGIGAETARYFAAAGASRIAILGRREQPLRETKASIESKYPGVEVFARPTDAFSRADVEAALKEFAARTADGKIHVVVANAASSGPLGGVNDADPDEFLQAVLENIRGAVALAQAYLRYAPAQDGVVIDVNSTAAYLNAGPGFSAYSTAKLAVFRVWDSFAYTNPTIHVFHTQPGVVDTDMNRLAGGVKSLGYEDHVSLPGSFHLWLASPEARFLRGKFLWSNWDVDELKARADEIQNSPLLNIGLNGWPFQQSSWQLGWGGK